MAGVEAIGVLASAAQLVHYSFALIKSLHDFYERVQASPERYQWQVDQLTELVDTVNLIKETESLDTPLVSKHLQAILIRVQSLNRTLEKAAKDAHLKTGIRLWKALWTAKREDRIQKGFSGLQEVKSSLVLCVLGTYGRVTLPTIQRTATSVSRIEQALEEGTTPQFEARTMDNKQPEFGEDTKGECKLSQSGMETIVSKSHPSTFPCEITSERTLLSEKSILESRSAQGSTPTEMQLVVAPVTSTNSGHNSSWATYPSTGAHSAAGPKNKQPSMTESATRSGHSYTDIRAEKSIAVLGNAGDSGASYGRVHTYQGLVFNSSNYIAGDVGKDMLPEKFFEIPR